MPHGFAFRAGVLGAGVSCGDVSAESPDGDSDFAGGGAGVFGGVGFLCAVGVHPGV